MRTLNCDLSDEFAAGAAPQRCEQLAQGSNPRLVYSGPQRCEQLAQGWNPRRVCSGRRAGRQPLPVAVEQVPCGRTLTQHVDVVTLEEPRPARQPPRPLRYLPAHRHNSHVLPPYKSLLYYYIVVILSLYFSTESHLLGRCFRFFYIFACSLVSLRFLCCYCFSGE